MQYGLILRTSILILFQNNYSCNNLIMVAVIAKLQNKSLITKSGKKNLV